MIKIAVLCVAILANSSLFAANCVLIRKISSHFLSLLSYAEVSEFRGLIIESWKSSYYWWKVAAAIVIVSRCERLAADTGCCKRDRI